jgi:hypothetical protein
VCAKERETRSRARTKRVRGENMKGGGHKKRCEVKKGGEVRV